MALILREMSTTYGRSALGYVWAILEPVAGLMLLTLIFSIAFRAPPIGTNFPLFYASGLLPFMAYTDISNKLTVSLRFSKPLLFYPAVTYLDALIARFALNALTQLMVFGLVLAGIILSFRLNVILDIGAVIQGLAMMLALSAGVGVVNCFLSSRFPLWERTWAILTRPLLVLSCVFFIYDNVPSPYDSYLWWNPLVHVVGEVRRGIYATYDDSYVSPTYVYLLSFSLLVVGLMMLRRYHRDIINDW